MTLACEDAYSKLVEVVTVVDVSDEDRVANTILVNRNKLQPQLVLNKHFHTPGSHQLSLLNGSE